jgi:hypothetical protein|tara:strand:+ start:253 stop:765 length:513 start_codon:yes stop_codon:yes gene_type:complete
MEYVAKGVASIRRALILDTAFILAIVYLPSLSHLLAIPLYRLEPMRMLIILALPFTSRKNIYFLALILPLASFITSGHPVPAKAFLMTGELLLNVWLFGWLMRRVGNPLGAMLSGITISKLGYYGVKFLLIQVTVISVPLVSSPLVLQAVLTIVFSLYIFVVYSRYIFHR